MRHVRGGFEFWMCCFPLREWGNWKLGRELATYSVGPLRFKFGRMLLCR